MNQTETRPSIIAFSKYWGPIIPFILIIALFATDFILMKKDLEHAENTDMQIYCLAVCLLGFVYTRLKWISIKLSGKHKFNPDDIKQFEKRLEIIEAIWILVKLSLLIILAKPLMANQFSGVIIIGVLSLSNLALSFLAIKALMKLIEISNNLNTIEQK